MQNQFFDADDTQTRPTLPIYDGTELKTVSLSLLSQEKRRMDSHETHLTGDEDIIITKTIRSVSGKN